MQLEQQTEQRRIDVKEVIARRSDLSTFVVHLTRAEGSETAQDRLKSIIRSKTIRAMSVQGIARKTLESEAVEETSADWESQKVVCFTETPLEHLYLLTQHIEGRGVELAPYGIAITKKLARENGVNPVWYVDITSGSGINNEWLTRPLNCLTKAAIQRNDFARSEIAKLAPFIEPMGTGTNQESRERYHKEFWWEREWRCRGDFKLLDRVLIL